jgi:sugar lactone lactonase YvrE
MNSFCGEAVKLRFGLSIYLDDKGIGLQRPEGLACNDKSLVVGDTGNNRLVRFMMEDKTVKAGAEIRIPQLSNPICVQINSKGEIFALDGKQRRIVRLNPKGEFRDFLSVEGAPPPSTFVPRSFKIDRTDTIYILDIFSARVLVLNPEGTYQRQIQFPKEYGFFSDLAVDATGTILLLDSIRAQVFSAAPNAAGFAPLTGSLKEYLNFPVNMTTDKQGKMYITDGNGGTIDILAQDGSFLGEQLSSGWNEGLLNFPAQACINEKDEIFIADRGNNRVQLFTIVK